MSKVSISNCINDGGDHRPPARTTYVSLHRWPELEAELVKSANLSGFRRGPMAVDSISCRQMYLRSYKFSKKETMPEKMKKYLTQATEKMVGGEWNSETVKKYGKRKCDMILRKTREVSISAIFRVFWKLLSGAAPIDVERK